MYKSLFIYGLLIRQQKWATETYKFRNRSQDYKLQTTNKSFTKLQDSIIRVQLLCCDTDERSQDFYEMKEICQIYALPWQIFRLKICIQMIHGVYGHFPNDWNRIMNDARQPEAGVLSRNPHDKEFQWTWNCFHQHYHIF